MYQALADEDKAKADALKVKPAAENEEALRTVATNGDTAEMCVLLAAGTDPDAVNEYGDTALGLAARMGHEVAQGHGRSRELT